MNFLRTNPIAIAYGTRRTEKYANKGGTNPNLKQRAALFAAGLTLAGGMAGWASAQLLSEHYADHLDPAVAAQRKSLQEAQARTEELSLQVGQTCTAAIQPYIDATIAEGKTKESLIWVKPERIINNLDKDLCVTIITSHDENITNVVKANNEVITQQYYLDERQAEAVDLLSILGTLGGMVIVGGPAINTACRRGAPPPIERSKRDFPHM